MRAYVMAMAVVLGGCPVDTTKTDTVGPTDATDGAMTDGATDTTTDATTGDTGVDETEIQFTITGDFAGTAITLTQLGLGDPPALGDVLASTTVTSATPTMILGAPPKSTLAPLQGFEGVEIASFIVALHADGDTNERLGKGEVYTGVGSVLLTFLDSDEPTLPLFLAAGGAVKGWNSIGIENGAITGSENGVLAVPIEVRPMADDITISGTYDLDDAPRFALIPQASVVYGGFPDDVLYDEAMDANWSITVKGAPPKQSLITGNPFLPDGSAVDSPFTYSDNDTSGNLTKGDVLLQQVCLVTDKSTEFVSLVYVPPNDNLVLNVVVAGRTGWMVQLEPDVKNPDARYMDGPVTGLTLCERL